jgi:hypothetical protein
MATCEQTKPGPTLRRLVYFADRFDSARQSRPVHIGTLTRWVKRGARAPNGQWIRLRAVRFPAGWRTCEEWVRQFIDELTSASMV